MKNHFTRATAILLLSLVAGLNIHGRETADLWVRLGHSGQVKSLMFSRSGNLLLTNAGDGSARLWDVAKARELFRFERRGTAVFGSSDENVFTTDETTFGVWSLRSLQEIRRFNVSCNGTHALSADGRRLAVACEDLTVRLWDVKRGKLVQIFHGHTQRVNAIAFSPDSKLLLTGSFDGTARLWTIADGRETKKFDLEHIEGVEGRFLLIESVAFSPEGHLLFIAVANLKGVTSSYKTHLLDATSGREIWSIGLRLPTFSKRGAEVLGMSDSALVLVNSADGLEIKRFNVGPSFFALSLAATDDGRLIAVGGDRGEVQTWDVATGRQLRRFVGLAAAVNSIASSPDGNQLILATGDAAAIVFDLDHGRELRRLKSEITQVFIRTIGLRGTPSRNPVVTSVLVSRDGGLAITASNDGIIRLWDLQTGVLQNRFETGGKVSSLALSSDKSLLVSVLEDGGWTQLWDISSGKQIREFRNFGNASDLDNFATSVALSPDKGRVLVGYGDEVARVWDVKTATVIQSISGYGQVFSVAFSPEGNQALLGTNHNIAVLWDLTTSKEIRTFIGHLGIVSSVAFSKDGTRILTCSEDRTVRLWDKATGHELNRFEGHDAGVTSAGFAADEQLVISGGSDGTTRFWNIATGAQIAMLVNFRGTGWAVVAPDGRFDTSDLDTSQSDQGAPLYWIMANHLLDSLPLEIFMRQYYTPRLLPRLLAAQGLSFFGRPTKATKLPPLPNIATLNRIQPQVMITKLERDPSNQDAMRIAVSLKAGTEGGKSGGAQDLRLFRDGQMVKFISGNLKDGEYLFAGIPLAHHGSNQQLTFTAYAFNNDLVKSETARQTYTLPANWPERKGRVFLVDIGINRTKAKGCTLQYAVSDALAMRSALTQRLQSAGYQVESTLLAADGPRDEANMAEGLSENGASKEGLRTVLAGIAAKATPDDMFILSYSGHGYTDAKGEFYLLPSDLKGDCDHPDEVLRQSAISGNDVTQWIRPIDAGEMVMILDACYSAASIESNDFKPGPMGSRGLGQLAYDKRIRVLAASQATQPAGEAGDLQMGYLTYALTKDGLERGKADWQPKDGTIWLREWLAYAVEQVPKLYTKNDSSDLQSASDKEKGIKLTRQIASLQNPTLFDFRLDQDQGIVLQMVK